MKQFWALFKFQAATNPFIWVMPIMFGLPFFIHSTFSGPYYSDLSTMLTVPNLFFVAILGSWSLAPEIMQPFGSSSNQIAGTEFLLTRAIDRPVLYRARSVMLFVLVILMPVVALTRTFNHPDIKVREYTPRMQQEILARLPGATLEPNPAGKPSVIAISRGGVLVEEWHFWMFGSAVVAVQAILLLIYPLKRRIWYFYGLFFLVVFLPLGFDLSVQFASRGPSPLQLLFFWFVGHQALFWILSATIFVVAQLAFERRFAQLEQ